MVQLHCCHLCLHLPGSITFVSHGAGEYTFIRKAATMAFLNKKAAYIGYAIAGGDNL